ncbi:Os04g0225034 [Oryza sativa Japonica Group]|uniref:Os04g0225034 protein n=1 Tax=Oryza sativa subsp. japonica TaxID=39947 RepID=A0A0P0W7Z4_ORYSJ|nr:Os04g0225034 [Oryza sativa Japonica Group]
MGQRGGAVAAASYPREQEATTSSVVSFARDAAGRIPLASPPSASAWRGPASLPHLMRCMPGAFGLEKADISSTRISSGHRAWPTHPPTKGNGREDTGGWIERRRMKSLPL